MANNHLIIGLGGTGGNVIKEYRKLYVEKNQSLDGLKNNIEFLWFDTSPSDMAKSDDWKANGINIGLEDNVDRFNMKAKGKNLYDILNSKSNYPMIGSWIGSLENEWSSAKISSKVVEGGSGQIRKLGRVNFANYTAEFNQQVKKKVTDLTVGKQGDSKADVHIIAGLAGGTGCGSFIDAIAQISENEARVENIFIYILTPGQYVDSDHTGKINEVSLYHANGYAALKDLNAFSLASGSKESSMNYNDEVDTLGCLSLFDLSDANFGAKIKLPNNKTYQVAYIYTDEAVGAGTTTLTEEQRWFRTANWLYIKTLFTNKNLKGQNTRIDTAENRSFTPSHLWGANPNNVGVGAMRLMIPKQQMRDYFKNYLLLGALKKIQFNNFKEKEGFANKPKDKDPEAYVELHKFLMWEWSLTIPQLGFDKIEAQTPIIHKNYIPKDFNIEEDIRLQLKELLDSIENFGYEGHPIEERDLLSKLDMAALKFVKNDFRSVGGVKYFQDWSKEENVKKYASYVHDRILNFLFGKSSNGTANWTPLSSVRDVIRDVRQNYFNKLKGDISTLISACETKRDVARNNFTSLESSYINEFGFFSSKTKRADFKIKALNALIDLFTATVYIESYNLALTFLTELQMNTLDSIEKIVEQASNGIEEMIRQFEKKMEEEDPRKNSKGNNGLQAYSPDKVINALEDSLMNNPQKFNDTISDIEKYLITNLGLLTSGKSNLEQITKLIESKGAENADTTLKTKLEDLQLDYDFYKDNLITILNKDYAGDFNNNTLKELLKNVYESAAPAIDLKDESYCVPEEKTIVILPMLIGVKDTAEIDFKAGIEKIMKGLCSTGSLLIVNSCDEDITSTFTTSSPEYRQNYDEIIIVRLKHNFPLAYLKVIQDKLYPEYARSIERLKNESGIDAKFLMHLQDYSHIPEILPIKERRRVEMYRPYVLLLKALDAFEKDATILKITEKNDIGAIIEDNSFFFDNNIENTLKGDVFYKTEKFSGWRSNRWIEPVTYFRLKEFTLTLAKNKDKTELLTSITNTFKELSSTINKNLYTEIEVHYDELIGIVENLHKN